MEVSIIGLVSKVEKSVFLCPECGGQVISIPESAEDVCSQCGLIINEKKIDFTSNGKRAYTSEERKARETTGPPISILMPDMALSTVINRSDIRNPDLKRAAKWNTRMSWDKRNLLIATTELKRISSNLNLPDHVKKEAIYLYKEAFKRKLLRGRSIIGMVAACLYFSIRKAKIPTTFHEILEETSETAKNVRRCYRALIRELNLKTPNTDPSSLIPKYIGQLELDKEIGALATKILKAYTSSFPISGKDPKGYCAGAIYLACRIRNINLTQKEIIHIVGVTEVTLRSRYKELRTKLNIKVQ